MYTIEIDLLILFLSIFVDLLFGEPPERLHMTVWMGKSIQLLKKKVVMGRPKIEKLEGILIGLTVVSAFAGLVYSGLSLLHSYLGLFAYILISALILKTTLAIKSMQQHTAPIAQAFEQNDYPTARKLLSYVVRRNTYELTEQQLLSAVVETIAEGTVDGVIGSLFFYSLFGVAGGVAYRAINTLDSELGYKDTTHLNVGWFSAKLDTIANYIPARVTGMFTVLSSFILGYNWSSCLKILKRDHGKTQSLNAGWPMAAMAGALCVMLEKPGFYRLGDQLRLLRPKNISDATNIMRLNIFLFILLVCIPLTVITRMLVPIV